MSLAHCFSPVAHSTTASWRDKIEPDLLLGLLFFEHIVSVPRHSCIAARGALLGLLRPAPAQASFGGGLRHPDP